jgi:hypothetical protein
MILSGVSLGVKAQTSSTDPVSPDHYLDDRSTPQSLIQSYYNAINRKEYLRAYSYWDNPGSGGGQPPSFERFQSGFAATAAVQVLIGTVSGDAGAGQIYYNVPVALTAETTSGALQVYAGCFTLHMSQPSFWAEPPYQGMGINSAKVQQLSSSANPPDLLANACSAAANQPNPNAPVTPTPDPASIDASRYLDDRSDPVQVVRSLFNAINRKEYVRAYSYWQNPANNRNQPPPFDQFQQGYQQTATVQLIAGAVTSDAGAGQLYYKLPVTLLAQTTAGVQQTYVGCYQLHLSQPAVQAAPPFVPLGIVSAQIQQVANNADTSALMNQACR